MLRTHLTTILKIQIQNKLSGIQLGIKRVFASLTAAIVQKTINKTCKEQSNKSEAEISIYILSGAETPSKLSVSSKQILAASQRASLASWRAVSSLTTLQFV